MDEKVEARLVRLKALRTEQGEPLVLEHENPIMKLKDAIVMAERSNLLFRYAMDGREFEYRVSEPAPVIRCKMTEAPVILCNLVESVYEAPVVEWEPTPEYAALLEEEPEEEAEPEPADEPERGEEAEPASDTPE